MEPTSAASVILQVQNIPIDQMKPNPWNRKTFDPGAMQELTGSIKVNGIIEPLIVRLMPDGSYEIASGNRRWLAAKEAGLKEVRCYVQNLSDEDVKDFNLIANIQREGVPVLEQARMAKERAGSDRGAQQAIALKLGKSPAWVSELISFMDMDAGAVAIFKALKIGWIPLRALKASPSEIQIQVANELKDGKLKPEGIAKRCAELGGGKKSKGKGQKEGQKPSSPFKFTRKDTQVTMTGILDNPDNLGGFFMDFQRAYHVWANKGAPQKADAATTPPASFPAVTGGEPIHVVNGIDGSPSRPPAEGGGTAPIAGPWPAVGATGSLGDDEKKKPHGIVPQRVAVPVPQIEEACYVKGDCLQLKWGDLGKGVSYRIQFTKDLENSTFQPLDDGKTVTTPGAIVNVYSGGDKEAYVAVQAIDAEGHFSDLSDPVKFELKAWNDEFSVKPLPMAVRNPTPAESPVLPPSSFPAPANPPVMSPEKQKAVQAALAMKAKLMRRSQ